MNRRELLAGVIGAAGCAALPVATKSVASPLPMWRFSDVTGARCGGSWMLEVGGRWITVTQDVVFEWILIGLPGRPRDGFFTDIAHSCEVECVA